MNNFRKGDWMSEQFEVLIDNDKLMKRVKEMAEELDKEYAGKTVHLIGILKGSVFFMTDLAKNMKSDVTMDFISVSSYGDGTESSGIVRLNKDLDESIEGKNVVIVEDIVDSGRTLSYVRKLFEDRRPASLKIITLLDKPDRRVVDCKVEMSGFVIPDKFIIGYGLDYAQKYRNLPYIAVIN
ncbi:hypoxanthine phosphoribosyltransferase [Eubacterium ruminantium]|uniref:Hypoxanthine phosphoribosyltransferase n=1 Tax=Eubacterium ruminantium TaxID=42322 RepID=A0A1T4LFL7_9FIRM|nr:hypoxanthine phosphoribosyltransferase [Eubacterium ruminantium]SDN26792.1 hypoxanthine phosphoribosyltransferase [Eubacterium ruminantium]SJZ53473.1 hypoxanthine phosphoribosyltransferase [Eubacterium ruminantium]